MKRCTHCILPDTVPGVEFDEEGVCSFCRSFEQKPLLGEAALLQKIEAARAKKRKYDALVPMSGGRDSTYVLYQAVKQWGLHVLAISYDNEFRYPQALANIEEACRRLNVEFRNIRSQNEIASSMVRSSVLSVTDFAQIPNKLCRACGYGYNSTAFRTAEEENAPLILWGASSTENTQAIARPAFAAIWHHPRWLQLTRPAFYAYQYYGLRQRMEFPITGNKTFSRSNPKLVTEGIDSVRIFDYVEWNRAEIKRTIMEELGWKKTEGHVSTWRNDCTLHPLMNFIHAKLFGCTKDCWGYCSMINVGQMTREEALSQEEETLRRLDETELEELLVERVGIPRRAARRITSYQGMA